MKFSGELLAASGTFAGRVEVGDYLKIGAGVSGTNDGIFVNTYNYWYDNGTFRVGDDDNYMSFGGGSATFKGALSSATGSFSGIVEAGSVKIGAGVSSTYNGVYIDQYNYWLDGAGGMKMGTEHSYLTLSSNVLTAEGLEINAGKFVSNIYDYKKVTIDDGYIKLDWTSGGQYTDIKHSGVEIHAGASGHVVIYGAGASNYDSCFIDQNSIAIQSHVLYSDEHLILTPTGITMKYLPTSATLNGFWVDGAGFMHHGSDAYKISVVPSIPDYPNANTIYFVTGS